MLMQPADKDWNTSSVYARDSRALMDEFYSNPDRLWAVINCDLFEFVLRGGQRLGIVLRKKENSQSIWKYQEVTCSRERKSGSSASEQ
ncbi:hypothetical protein Q7C36_000524 [Tachysurus vachellii]|uniref:Uncharacterized protein n=1 Tax=Tachysurus vachellii TaxID=175792 RepID=A0AA88T967_TACVA|nr:hypothetical protein Q7C36_000524 [Tachysurus vachellii]